jgi:hypothetical protein
MCCLFTSLLLLGPRAAVIIWWILQPARWDLAFSSWLWPVIGFFIAPWTTLMWVIVAPGGVAGLDFLWIGLAILADIAFWSGGAWGNRGRIPGSAQAA